MTSQLLTSATARAAARALIARSFPALRNDPAQAPQRWPQAFFGPNVALWGLSDGPDLVAALVERRLSFGPGPKAPPPLIEIGFVCVDPQRRGQGWGLRLMRDAAARAEVAPGGAVLWSGKVEFYRAAGWRSVGADLFGVGRGAPGRRWDGALLDVRAAAQIERLRRAPRQAPAAPPRDAAARRACPPPTRALRCALDPAGRAYALAGLSPLGLILFELGGDPTAAAALADRLSAGRRAVWVNAPADGLEQRWAEARLTGLRWRSSSTTMIAGPAQGWERLRYLDRI